MRNVACFVKNILTTKRLKLRLWSGQKLEMKNENENAILQQKIYKRAVIALNTLHVSLWPRARGQTCERTTVLIRAVNFSL